MKTLFNLRNMALVIMAVVVMSCASSQNTNHGTAADRTGTNGATNGTGKVPLGK